MRGTGKCGTDFLFRTLVVHWFKVPWSQSRHRYALNYAHLRSWLDNANDPISDE